MPFVVTEAETSIITGPSLAGIPTANGSGVNTACVPPNGATLAVAGSEQATIASKPSLAGRSRYAARQAM